ncbi:MAG: HEPN domain-containing protein [Microcystis sp.]|uniref:ApeA N-terminal domain 1-containing protein n=1 Tax=Microcystis sp. TaxID=1127 RepID=UPI00391DD8C4
MLEEFVSLGKWWLPNKPEVVVPGKLSFSPESGATLELIGSFYSSQLKEIGQVKISSIEGESNLTSGVRLDFIKPEEIIILGLLDNNEKITLYRCSGQVKSFELTKLTASLSFNVEYVFRKIHFEYEQDIKLKSISVQYSHLEKWVGKSGIQVFASQEENKIWMSYQPPSSIHLAKIGSLDLYITFSSVCVYPFYPNAYNANIEQKTYLTIQNPCNQPIDDCVNLLIRFSDLLSFAMTKATSVIKVTGKADVIHEKPVQQANGDFTLEKEARETQVIIIFGLWNPTKSSEINLSPDKMLFLFSDVENNLGSFFEAWINKREEYEPVFDLLMATMYSSSLYLGYKFLNIIQALEAYHTRKYEGSYQDKKIYKKGLYKKFIEVLNDFPSESDNQENGISDEFRNALKGKLKNQTSFTLETRLKEIINKVSSLLPNNFIGSVKDRELFSRRAYETRNALTHHNKEKRQQAARGRELFQLFHTLTVILQICLLRELNLPDESIKILVERNRAYQKEWRPSSN